MPAPVCSCCWLIQLVVIEAKIRELVLMNADMRYMARLAVAVSILQMTG